MQQILLLVQMLAILYRELIVRGYLLHRKTLKIKIINKQWQILQYTMNRYYYMIVFFMVIVHPQISICPKGCSQCSSPAKCIACSNGFELNTMNSCILAGSSECSTFNVDSITCLICQPTFKSVNGSCIKDLTGCIKFNKQICTKCGFGMSLVNGSCTGILNCQNYKNTSCIKCSSDFYLGNGICYYTNNSCLRIDYATGACIKCKVFYTLIGYKCISSNVSSSQCYIYDYNRQCQYCKEGYQLVNNSCIIVPICANGSFINSQNLCQSLPVGCKGISNQTYECLDCSNNYVLSNGTCAEILPQNCLALDNIGNCVSCRVRYYAINFTCQLVSPFCLLYRADGKCLNCNITYFTLYQGLCKDPFCLNMTEDTCTNCQANYQYDNITMTCNLVDPNCLNLSNIHCSQCIDGFYITVNVCQPLPEYCLSADKTGKCLNCSQNCYMQFNQCYQINATIQNCRVYSQISSIPICSMCQIGYFVNLGVCVLLVPFCNLLLSNGKCVICQNSYTLISGICRPINTKQKDANCLSFLNNTCVRCSSRSVLGINGVCYIIDQSKCLTYNGGDCTQCSANYIVSRGICIFLTVIDVNCKNYNNQQCIECYSGYYLSQNLCKLPNTNCSSSSLANGGCLTCYRGFTLTNFQCVVISSINNCLAYDGFGNCLQCARMYYVSNNTCLTVNPLCQNYNPFNGYCTSCFPGYGVSNKTCIKQNTPQWSNVTNLTASCILKRGSTCIECPNRYYLRNNICNLVSGSCLTYNLNGNCITCQLGYFISNYNCISYGSLNGSDQNCKTFQSQSFCLQCYNGFVSIQGLCQSVNPLCNGYDNTTGSCINCYEGYNLMNGSCSLGSQSTIDPCLATNQNNSCISCIISYNLIQGKCVYNSSQKVNNFNLPFCQIASNQSYCNLCLSGFYARLGNCYEVSSYCQTYNPESGNCLTCKPSYIFQNGACIFPAMGIDNNCQTYVGVYCNKCISNYYLKNYICQIIDPHCTNFNFDINQCLSCAIGKPNFDICQL